jgi:hypothetical protein
MTIVVERVLIFDGDVVLCFAPETNIEATIYGDEKVIISRPQRLTVPAKARLELREL